MSAYARYVSASGVPVCRKKQEAAKQVRLPGTSATRRERGAFHLQTLLDNLMAPLRGHTLRVSVLRARGPTAFHHLPLR